MKFIPIHVATVTATREPVERASFKIDDARDSSIPEPSMAPPNANAATTRATVDIIDISPPRESRRSTMPTLVRTATDGNVRVRPGDEIMGWRVASIGEDHIQLRRATQTRMLTLPRDP